LLTETKHNLRGTTICLLRLDLDNGKCTLLDVRILDISIRNFIFDTNCRHNFVISDTDCLKIARVGNNQLIIDDRQISLNSKLYFPRLEDNLLQGVHINADRNNCFEFGEYLLTTGNNNPVFNKLFDIEQPAEIKSANFLVRVQYYINIDPFIQVNYDYGLSSNFHYIPRQECDHENIAICSFNLNERKLNLIKQISYCGFNFMDLYLDEDGMMTIVSSGICAEQSAVHRFPLR
jgi:hypothetical protein